MKKIYGIFTVLALFAGGAHAMDKHQDIQCASQKSAQAGCSTQMSDTQKKELFREFSGAYYAKCDELGLKIQYSKKELEAAFEKRIAQEIREGNTELTREFANEVGRSLVVARVIEAQKGRFDLDQQQPVAEKKRDVKDAVLDQSPKAAAVSDAESGQVAFQQAYRKGYRKGYRKFYRKERGKRLADDELNQRATNFLGVARAQMEPMNTRAQLDYMTLAGKLLAIGYDWEPSKIRVMFLASRAPAIASACGVTTFVDQKGIVPAGQWGFPTWLLYTVYKQDFLNRAHNVGLENELAFNDSDILAEFEKYLDQGPSSLEKLEEQVVFYFGLGKSNQSK